MAFVFYILSIFLWQMKTMNLPFISDKTYANIDFTRKFLLKAEYDNCVFIDCLFTDS